ncbi:hypothetical protein CHS0354_014239 [Potamilus streckersoni]|uniref:WKF domain-containing protein n=1 Tax=Potamilus streckersoni TaxID=2493646 RepID=A0AAE0SB84_9BIVA|nr:hypothetical protein CHS0354_014239 [Potamilus streckersoni]
MKRRRDEENGKLDAVEIKKLKKKSSHHQKNEAPVCIEEKWKPSDLKEYRSDVKKISKKHKVLGFEPPEMESNEKIGKTKHEITEKNASEKQEKDTDANLFQEKLKKHAVFDLGFSETIMKDTIRKKRKKKHTTKTDNPDKSETRNSGLGLDASQDSDLRLSESDSIGIKIKKKHKDSILLQESSYVSGIMKAKKKNQDKKKRVDNHIPVLVESIDTADFEPDKEISENKKSLSENCARSNDEKSSKQSKKKKKMKSIGKTLKQKSDSDSQTNALDYLRQWQSDEESWKFQKVRQVWLLHNVYNKDKIGEEDFDILLRYLEPLRGRAREKTLSEAEEIMKSVESQEEADMDEEKLLKVHRARQVIQILSIEPGQ